MSNAKNILLRILAVFGTSGLGVIAAFTIHMFGVLIKKDS